MNPGRFADVYGELEQAAFAKRLNIVGGPLNDTIQLANYAYAKDIEIVLGGWGIPRLDAAFFEICPAVRLVLYAAGAVNRFMTADVWARNISVCTANSANGVAVAEYTIAQVYMCLKRIYQYASRVRTGHNHNHDLPVAGGLGSTLGLVSLGAIGRLVIERLRISDLQIVAFDPFVSKLEAQALGVQLCSLEEVFAISDVVSCHAPWLPETEGLLTASHFGTMKKNASFINTARGAIVRESELIAVLQSRPDLFAILDVTWPEPPHADSPLYTLPNVLLTPHIAGTMGAECRRMSQLILAELDRYLAGEPLRHLVTREYARAYV